MTTRYGISTSQTIVCGNFPIIALTFNSFVQHFFGYIYRLFYQPFRSQCTTEGCFPFQIIVIFSCLGSKFFQLPYPVLQTIRIVFFIIIAGHIISSFIFIKEILSKFCFLIKGCCKILIIRKILMTISRLLKIRDPAGIRKYTFCHSQDTVTVNYLCIIFGKQGQWQKSNI